MFKAKEIRRLLKLIATRKGPFVKPIRRRMPLEWKLKNIVSSKKLKRRPESDGGIDEHKVHLKPEEQNRILWVCQYTIYIINAKYFFLNMIIRYIWASSRENLSSGCPKKAVSSQSSQLQRLARKSKFHL